MDILPDEIESVKVIGDLHDNDVKLIKTIGGFYLAIGRKSKNSKKHEALAAGSHQAIVAHQLSKNFGSDFKPAMFKSEHESLEKVENKTEYLPQVDIEKGKELFVLSKKENVDFILYRHGITLGQYKTRRSGTSLIIENKFFKKEVLANKDTATAISRAIKDKMYDLGLSKIEEK